MSSLKSLKSVTAPPPAHAAAPYPHTTRGSLVTSAHAFRCIAQSEYQSKLAADLKSASVAAAKRDTPPPKTKRNGNGNGSANNSGGTGTSASNSIVTGAAGAADADSARPRASKKAGANDCMFHAHSASAAPHCVAASDV